MFRLVIITGLAIQTLLRNPNWYRGEAFWETAEKDGITTASYFWPGSEMNDPKRRPTYFERYKHNEPYKNRIDGVIDWLRLPFKQIGRISSLSISMILIHMVITLDQILPRLINQSRGLIV